MKNFLMLALVAMVAVLLGGKSFAGEVGSKGQAPSAVKGQIPKDFAPAVKGQAPKGQAPVAAVKGQAPTAVAVASRKTTVTETVTVTEAPVTAEVVLFKRVRSRGKLFAAPATCTGASCPNCNQ